MAVRMTLTSCVSKGTLFCPKYCAFKVPHRMRTAARIARARDARTPKSFVTIAGLVAVASRRDRDALYIPTIKPRAAMAASFVIKERRLPIQRKVKKRCSFSRDTHCLYKVSFECRHTNNRSTTIAIFSYSE